MIFNSITFIIFLVFVVFVFWQLNSRYKTFFLVLSSCVFYGFWRWDFIPLIFISAISDYYISKGIFKSEDIRTKKILLFISITLNLSLLFYFKYLYFFLENSNLLFEFLNLDLNFKLFYIILPFGISFYTFETISYTVDVYRGMLKPEKKFIDYALFVTFFPKLVAGPIQRANELIPQFKNWRTFELSFFSYGLKRILYGLFLKVVFADNIGTIVDEMYLINYDFASAIDVLTMSFLFGFQIYFDFSAYSHIALGSALLFGIKIPENFNFPYIAISLKDFWKRWHISLSAWIRDYLYLPLSGVKVFNSSGQVGIGKVLSDSKNKRSNIPLFVTWAIMGLWHGANWTFLFWGLFHAFFIFLERLFKPLRNKFSWLNIKLFNWGITLIISMLSWIPFRVNSIEETLLLYSKLFDFKNFFNLSFRENSYIITLLILFIFICSYYFKLLVVPRLKNNYVIFLIYTFFKYLLLIFFIIIFLKPVNQFIYFQF